MKSEAINELTKALSKMQGELTSVPKESVNPFFKSKYASLDAIWDTIRKPLSANGLSIIQTIGQDEKGIFVDTMLCHTSGQFVSSYLPINAKEINPQAIGSSITYARRYSLSAILGVSADDDDDGESSTHKKTKVQVEGTKEQTTLVNSIGDHICKIHKDEHGNPIKFFMAGKMKSFAHPVDGQKEWCYEHTPVVESAESKTDFDNLKSNTPAEPVKAPEKKAVPVRDPATITDLPSLWKACHTDFKMSPQQCLAELGVNSINDITDTPRESYVKIAEIVAATKGN